jgi:hypothetical protein
MTPRIRTAVFCVMLAMSAACGLEAARAHDAAHPSGSASAPIDSVLISADGRTISASESGPCLPSAVLRARESDTEVVLKLQTLPHTSPCFGPVGARTWATRLASPLGTRQVTDAADGRGIAIFDERGLLRPSRLPIGYAFSYTAAMYATGAARAEPDWDASCAQLYTNADGDQLWITQTYGKHWPPRLGPTAALVPVRHSLARTAPGTVAWQEHGQSFLIVSSTPEATTALPIAELIAVADTLGSKGG